MFYRFRNWIIFLLVCVVCVPILIFAGGWLLAGPYEGESGIFGLMAAIYGDALRGSKGAWLTLLAPVLLVLIWSACLRLQRGINSRTTGNA